MSAERSQTVYGIHAVAHVLRAAPARVTAMLALQDRPDGRVAALVEQASAAGISVNLVAADVLDRQCGGVHQGIAVKLRPSEPWDEKSLLRHLQDVEQPLLLVLDGVKDPHNLGACLRVADGAGADAVVVPRDRAVGLTAAVRKVACGAAETTPLVRVRNLARAMRGFERGRNLVCRHPCGRRHRYTDADLSGSHCVGDGRRGKRTAATYQ